MDFRVVRSSRPRVLALALCVACAASALSACAGVEKRSLRVVHWDNTKKAALESRINQGVTIVRIEDETFEVLSQCEVAPTRKFDSYDYHRITLKKERVTARNDAELEANFPLGPADLSTRLEEAGELSVDMVVVGTWETPGPIKKMDSLEGDCEGATHVITGARVGAYRFYEGVRSAGSGNGDTWLGEGGGSVSGGETVLKADGDESSCGEYSRWSSSPPRGCGAILEIDAVSLPETLTDPEPEEEEEEADEEEEKPAKKKNLIRRNYWRGY